MSIITFIKNKIFGEKKNGLYKSNDALGRLHVISYVNGIKEGAYKIYHVNGKLFKETYHINDKKEGIEKSYYMNGDFCSQVTYVDGEKEGKELEIRIPNYLKNMGIDGFSDYNDSKETVTRNEFNYVNGVREGVQKTFFHNSNQLKHEYTLVNGKNEGLDKRYYENGNLSSEEFYVQGLVEGLVRSFHENGKLKYEGECSGHKYHWQGQQGLWKFYSEDGSLEYEKFYKDGKEITKS